jgi:NADH-quinone oxidoreductase subunit F
MHRILTRLEKGAGRRGDLELLLDICANMKGKTICPLSDAAAMPIESYIQKFYNEFTAHIQEQRCVVA